MLNTQNSCSSLTLGMCNAYMYDHISHELFYNDSYRSVKAMFPFIF